MRDAHILDRIEPLHRYRYVALGATAIAFAVAVVQTRGAATIYQARARLRVQQERAGIVPGLPVPIIVARILDQDRYFQVQIEALHGRELAQRTIRAMGLRSPADLDAPPTPPDQPGTPTPALVGAFLGRVGVEPMRDSMLVDVTFRSGNPKFAAAAVNAISVEYVALNRDMNAQARKGMVTTLEKAVDDQSDKVKTTERQLNDLAARSRETRFGERQSGTVSRMLQTSDALTRATVNRVEKEARYKRSQQANAVLDEVADDPLLARRAELERDRARLSERYGPNHPALQTVVADLAAVEQQIDRDAEQRRNAIKLDYERAVAEERALAGNLARERAAAASISQENADYATLERQARTERQVYESLLASLSAVRLADHSTADTVRIIERGDVPSAPLPAAGRGWLFTLSAGLAIAAAFVFGLDYLNDTLRTPDDVAAYLKAPLLGFVPAGSGGAQPLLASTHTPDEFSEAIRAIRTALTVHVPSRGAGTVVGVTSTQPREGKTTTACNLAMALSLAGSRVLLIDADMRRPRVHDALGLSNEKGLSTILQGRSRIRDVLQRSADPNLLVICAGPAIGNSSELLSSEHMAALVTSLRRSPFEWVVVDTPPVLAATDAVVVSPIADAMVFVVGSGVTRRRLARRAVETLVNGGASRLCTLLNNVNVSRHRYYYSRRYGHHA